MKYAWIERHRDQFHVTRMCRQLGVSRTGFVSGTREHPVIARWLMRFLMRKCRASCTEQAQLRPAAYRARLAQSGSAVGNERVRKSLERQACAPLYKRPYRVTTDSAHKKPIAPHVLKRRFEGWQVNQAWVADIGSGSVDEALRELGVLEPVRSPEIAKVSIRFEQVRQSVQAADAAIVGLTRRSPVTAGCKAARITPDFRKQLRPAKE